MLLALALPTLPAGSRTSCTASAARANFFTATGLPRHQAAYTSPCAPAPAHAADAGVGQNVEVLADMGQETKHVVGECAEIVCTNLLVKSAGYK
jgi:hypothetical protein